MLTCEQFNEMMDSGILPHDTSETMRDAMKYHFDTCNKCRTKLESDVKEICARPIPFGLFLYREIRGAQAAALGRADERRRKAEMD